MKPAFRHLLWLLTAFTLAGCVAYSPPYPADYYGYSYYDNYPYYYSYPYYYGYPYYGPFYGTSAVFGYYGWGGGHGHWHDHGGGGGRGGGGSWGRGDGGGPVRGR